MKALVTGATGFVGSHLVERLLADGHEVVATLRPTSDTRWLEGLPAERRVASLDDPESLRRAVEGAEWVFHVAGLTRARSERVYMATNAEGTRRLLEAAAEARSVQRFIYVSSLAAAGPSADGRALVEADEPRPLPGYGASKLAGERAVAEFADRLAVAIVRPPAIYGPRDRNFTSLFRAARRLGIAPVAGDKNKKLTLVYVGDLVECLVLAAANERAVGQTYFVGSGTHTWAQVVEALSRALGRTVRAFRIPKPLAVLAGELGELKWTLTRKPQILCRRKIRDLLQPHWVCSWEKAQAHLGYRPATGLEDGLRRTARWYEEQGML